MHIRPISDAVLVRVDEREPSSPLIQLPTEQPACTGVVVSVGAGKWYPRAHGAPGYERRNTEVEVGERVVFHVQASRCHGAASYLEDKHVLIRESDIMLVVPPGGPEVTI